MALYIARLARESKSRAVRRLGFLQSKHRLIAADIEAAQVLFRGRREVDHAIPHLDVVLGGDTQLP